jgi:hypothetical protein
MAISNLGICNSALIKLGVEKISVLDSTTRQGAIMNEQFDKLRDALLYDHPWNFAMRWCELASADADDTHDNPEYTYRHPMPTGALRVWSTEYDDEDYEVLEGYVYSDSETLKIKCIMQITDPTKFTPAFAEALACKLAHDNCYALVQSNSLKGTLWGEMEAYIPRVKSGDAQENRAKSLTDDIFLNARY